MRSSKSLAAAPLLLGAPSRAFEAIRERPGWVGAFLLGLALVTVSTWIQLPQILREQVTATRAVLEKMDMPEEEVAKAIERIPDPDNLSGGEFAQQVLIPVPILVAFFFLGAFVFHLIVRAFGAEPRFPQTLGVYALAALAPSVGAVVKAALVRATDSLQVSLGPGALLPGISFDSPTGIFLDLFDVFSIANAILLAIGARIALGATPSAARGAAIANWTLQSIVVFLLRFLQTWISGRS